MPEAPPVTAVTLRVIPAMLRSAPALLIMADDEQLKPRQKPVARLASDPRRP
jgi:hypothetical protein